MITDEQVENVFQFKHKNKMTVKAATAKAAMSESTVRKNLRSGETPERIEKAPCVKSTRGCICGSMEGMCRVFGGRSDIVSLNIQLRINSLASP